MDKLADRVAAITGAASGIGRALALNLARRGCHLAISDLDAAGLDATRAEAARAGVRVTTARVDVADRARVFAWADEVAREHGGCNVIINNAGVALAGTVERVPIEDFQWLMNINFWGVVHGTQAFLPHLRRSGQGHVVNISSVFGLVGVAGQGTYNASKFAVRGFTEALRQELRIERAQVSATCVHPGGVKTNIARSARVDPSVRDLGATEESVKRFDRAFRTTPDEAAETIVRGVLADRARVLIGADARLLDAVQRIVPGSYHAAFARFFTRAMK